MASVLTLPVHYDNGHVIFKQKKGLPRGIGEGVLVLPNVENDRPAKKTEPNEGFESLFGMWADRKDTKDSVKWVNDLRARRRYPHPLK